MNILVCIKQVPELEHITVEQGADGSAVVGELTEFRMNRFDEFAVEAALLIKEALPEVRIDVLTAGPPRASEAIKRAVGMGADQGIHLRSAAGSDPAPAAVSSWIARYAQDKGYALILTGSLSEDGMHGQVGAMTAAHLDLPCATQVIHVQLSDDQSGVTVQREIEGGSREMLCLELPALLALQPGINRPRYPSLSNLLRANRQKLETVDVDSFGELEAPVVRVGMDLPQQARTVEILSGTAQEKAERFLSILREKAFIR